MVGSHKGPNPTPRRPCPYAIPLAIAKTLPLRGWMGVGTRFIGSQGRWGHLSWCEQAASEACPCSFLTSSRPVNRDGIPSPHERGFLLPWRLASLVAIQVCSYIRLHQASVPASPAVQAES